MTTPRATPAGSPAQFTSAAAPVRPAGSTPAGPVGTNGGPAPAALGSSSSSSSSAPRKVKGVRRPPRLASLQLKRVDPWTVLKISLIVAIVMFFVWMIAVGVLYLSLGSMDVWDEDQHHLSGSGVVGQHDGYSGPTDHPERRVHRRRGDRCHQHRAVHGALDGGCVRLQRCRRDVGAAWRSPWASATSSRQLQLALLSRYGPGVSWAP